MTNITHTRGICHTAASVLYFGVLAARHMGSYLTNQESNQHPLTLEGKMLMTGPSGKSTEVCPL